MKQNYRCILYFGIAYLLFFSLSLILILSFNKVDLHLILTSVHTPALDTFFRYLTEAGGFVPFVVAVLFLLYSFSTSFYILTSLLVNAVFTRVLKRIFSMPRPKAYFSDFHPDIILHKVDGVTMHSGWNSFPSGHTSAIFALMVCVALLSNLKYKQIGAIYCLIAILVGYSRVYLSQHFAEDILAGSFLGTICGLVLYPVYAMASRPRGWVNRSIWELFYPAK